MSLLSSYSGPSFVSAASASSSSFTTTVSVAPISTFSLKRADFTVPKPSFGHCFSPPIASQNRGTFTVKASENTSDGEEAESESDTEDLLQQDGLLDAKLISKLEKKMKMKVSKKIRLRRKKLVHKRRLRKKGRWPPSKMKKLSNV